MGEKGIKVKLDKAEDGEESEGTEILADAYEAVYERPGDEPEDTFETIAGKWTAHVRALLREQGIDPEDFQLEGHDVANMMVDLKTSRNAEGHYHDDNYVDIAGYAENGARLELNEEDQ